MKGDPENSESASAPQTRSMSDENRPAKPIRDLLDDPDFPRSALSERVDIGGYIGEVVDVVKQSLKVKSADGVTKSFNANGLRRIYGRMVPPEPPPAFAEPPRARPERFERSERSEPAPPPLPPPPPTIEPDFEQPVRNITEFVARPDYPACLIGQHIDVGGYTGVVVQIINRSLKVRSRSETTRSYNADALKKLHTS